MYYLSFDRELMVRVWVIKYNVFIFDIIKYLVFIIIYNRFNYFVKGICLGFSFSCKCFVKFFFLIN